VISPLDVISGRARWCLIRGDSRLLLPHLPSKVPRLHVITDPPFDQGTSEGARSLRVRTKHPNSSILSRFIGFDGVDGQEAALVESWLRVATRWCIAFCALEQLGAYKKASPKTWVRSTAWNRTNPAPQFTGDRPGQRHEGITIHHQPGKKRWNRGGECWAPTGATAVADRKLHPTPKPLWLMREIVWAFTDPGDVVLDAFAGSGTTGVACLELGRRFIGVELSPAYARTAVRRLRHADSGRPERSAA
jgi:site-specific DNA-methyltransferase (adenine-specific)